MNNLIAFDIETGRSDNYEVFEPDYKVPKDGRSKSVEIQKIEWEDKLALSPITGEVLVIGYYNGKEYIIDEGDEEFILRNFWGRYIDYKKDCKILVGHNIKRFDLPFIIRRSLKYGIVPEISMDRDKHKLDFFIDTMEVWQQGVYEDKFTSLDTLAKFFGVGQKTGEGKDFAKLYLSDDKQIAIDYLKNDLDITYKVACMLNI